MTETGTLLTLRTYPNPNSGQTFAKIAFQFADAVCIGLKYSTPRDVTAENPKVPLFLYCGFLLSTTTMEKWWHLDFVGPESLSENLFDSPLILTGLSGGVHCDQPPGHYDPRGGRFTAVHR